MYRFSWVCTTPSLLPPSVVLLVRPPPPLSSAHLEIVHQEAGVLVRDIGRHGWPTARGKRVEPVAAVDATTLCRQDGGVGCEGDLDATATAGDACRGTGHAHRAPVAALAFHRPAFFARVLVGIGRLDPLAALAALPLHVARRVEPVGVGGACRDGVSAEIDAEGRNV